MCTHTHAHSLQHLPCLAVIGVTTNCAGLPGGPPAPPPMPGMPGIPGAPPPPPMPGMAGGKQRALIKSNVPLPMLNWVVLREVDNTIFKVGTIYGCGCREVV